MRTIKGAGRHGSALSLDGRFRPSATGQVVPCSEFIGFPEFSGGNLFENPLPEILESRPFQEMKARVVEDIDHCHRCAVRHYCGAPCPAEVYALTGSLKERPPYCDFYALQARYAFRVIADGRLDTFLWDGCQEGLKEVRVI